MKLFLPALLLAVMAFGCNNGDNTKTPDLQSTFVNPPMPGVEPKFSAYAVEAGRGDTIVHATGSMLLFQPDAFLDKDGKIVKGNVEVKYREFNSPIDFYLAGISMNYDSSGTGYTLESSGMCEILASKDGEPVFVNPDRKPKIVYATYTNAPNHNVYYLDTAKRNWVYDKPSVPIAASSTGSVPAAPAVTDRSTPPPPMMPVKADEDKPVIKILIDTSSFKELKVYDNLKFQIDKNEKNFKSEDADEQWTDVELQKSNKGGLYRIRFTNPKRTVVYSARPVLEGEDYNKALKTFEKNNAQYKKDIASRLNRDAEARAQYERDTLRNLALEKENLRISALNQIAEKYNRRIDSLDAAIVAENQRRVDERNAIIDSEKFYRAFSVTRFGIWNCDQPLQPDYLPITANFVDGNDAPLTLTNIGVVYSDMSSLINYPDNNIRLTANGDVMVFGKVNGRFAYVSFDAYRKIERPAGATQIKMPVTVVAEKDNNYDYIAAIAKGSGS